MSDQGRTEDMDAYVTRRELYWTIKPLIEKQQELTEVMTGIGKDLKRLILAAERHEGAMQETARQIDNRRFLMTLVATLCAGIIVYFLSH